MFRASIRKLATHRRVTLGALIVTLSAITPALAQTSPGTAVPGDPFEVHGLLYSGSAPTGFLLGDAWAQGATHYGVLDADGLPALDGSGVAFRASRMVDSNWGNQGDGIDYSVFAGGNKNDDLIGPDVSTWEWDIGGGGPQKNDITNTYFHTRVDPITGDRWVFVGAETRSINGDSHVDFEFNQAGVVQLGDTSGTLLGLGPDGGRTVDDFLISVDFTNGGVFPVASVRVWTGAQFEEVSLPGAIYSASNLIDIPHGSDGTWKHFTGDGAETNVLTHLQLVEAGVNLTELGILVDACATDATFMPKTRSSSSWTSDLKDYAIVRFPLEPAPEVTFSRPDEVCPGQSFDASAEETTGLPNASLLWSVSGCGTITSDPTASTVTVQADEACNCDITLSLTVSGGWCNYNKTFDTVIHVGDTTDPVLSDGPADGVAECDAIPVAPELTATDECIDPEVIFHETSEPGACEGEETLIREWQATDFCDNVGAHTQVIVVQDTTAPTLIGLPDDTTVSCDAVPPAADVTANDNCSTPTVGLNETTEPGACPAAYTLLRTWTATDDCGNPTEHTQTIAVEDTAAPQLVGVPTDATYECDSLPLPPEVTATDNCTTATVTFDETTEPGDCVGSAQITRTWTAEDECTNSVSDSQVITLEDTTPPVIENGPDDIVAECSDIPAPPDVTATDNCSEATVTLNTTNDPGIGEGKGLITRVWTATDSCGNSSTHTQLVMVVDTTAPELHGLPGDATVECSAVPDPPEVTATDNCASPAVQYDQQIEPGDCSGRWTIHRTWSATDDCGNTTSHTQTITVVDTTPPSFGPLPEDTTAECDDVPAAATVTASDLCGDATVELVENSEPGSCQGSSTITRTWTATDDCGNEASHTQTIDVSDTTDPTLSDDPADIVVECDSVPDAKKLTASDNCSSAPDVAFDEIRTPGACEGEYELTREWSATDDCGNAASVDQIVTVQDTTAPKIQMSPHGTAYICDGAPVSWTLGATDNCSNAAVSLSEITSISANSRDRVNVTELGGGQVRITASGPALIWGSAVAQDDCGNGSAPFEFRVTAEHGFEACSQGFWKNHFERWGPTGFAPDDLFVDAFQITDLSSSEIPASFSPTLTLGDATAMSGGDFNQVLVQGTAALLNAASAQVDYPATVAEVRAIVQAAFAGDLTMNQAQSMLTQWQSAEGQCGCPID